jgi:hypothetical protein
LAVTWDENINTIKVYEGDEDTQPSVTASSTDWYKSVSGLSPVVNNIMNSRGGIYYVDGRIDEFRYFNASRSLSNIQDDYNTYLSGSESNLVHYYKFEDDLTDSAGSADCIKANSYGNFYSGGPFLLNYKLDLEVQFSGVYDSPNITEKVCVKTGSFKGTEDISLAYWSGISWNQITNSLVSNSWNNFTVSVTSPTFTIKFSDSFVPNDTGQDYWEIDSIFLLVEGPEEVVGVDSGFVWLEEPDEVDLGATYDEWVINQDLSDDSVPSVATDRTADMNAVARGSQDTNDYMNQGSSYCKIEAETFRMQVVKLKDHRYIDTWRKSVKERLYVMGYTVGADPTFKRVASDLGDVTADSSWHRMKISNIHDSTSGIILFTQSTSDEDTTILVRAVGSADSMTSREWEEFNCGMMFVKLDAEDQFEYYVSNGRTAKFYLIAEINKTIDWLNTNRVDISATSTGEFTRDLDEYISISSNASGVILQHESIGTIDYKNVAREDNQEWEFPKYDVGGGQWLMGGSSFDSSNRIEIIAENIEQDLYIHAITVLYDDSSPVFNNSGVDDSGTGEGVFWAEIIDSSEVENVMININESYDSMNHNGTHWIYLLSITDYNDYLEYQIWNATDSRGNSQTSPTIIKHHTFNRDIVTPTVLEMDYFTDLDTFNTSVMDTWGIIDTVIVNVTSRGGKTAIMRKTPSGYVNDTIDLLEGVFLYEIIVNDSSGNTLISSESADYSSGIKPIAVNLTLKSDNVTVYSNQRLEINYDYDDADDDAESGTEIRWYNNSTLFPIRNDKDNVPALYLNKGDLWYVTVRPKDGKKFGVLKTSVSITVRNSPPEVSNYAISPADPTNITNLNASFGYFDEDNDPLTFTIEWYKNDINQTHLYNITRVEAANTTKGEEWFFKIIAYDGENYSDWYTANTVEINNSAPTIIGTPTFNETVSIDQNDDLKITYEYDDMDNDSEVNITTDLYVKWYKWNETHGVVYQPQKDNNTELLSSETRQEEVWFYIIRVYDGYLYSGEYESVHVSIAFLNTVPGVDYLNITSFSNENLTINDITLNYTYSDLDGHSEVGTIIVWYLNRSGEESVKYNNTLTHENHDTIVRIQASELQKGDQWWCSVRPKDGIGYGEISYSFIPAIIIRNSLPSASDLSITDDAYNTTNLVADWNFDDNDTEDSESAWNITWHIQGVGRQFHLDGMKTVEAGNTTKGQVWYYFILVNDSEQWSLPINSSEKGITVKIRNTLPEVSGIVISPNPYNTTNLEADWTFIDLDNDPDLRFPEYINISWYKNGIIQPHLIDAVTIGAGNTSKGEYWYYTLQVFDSENWSAGTYSSPAVSILNSPPILSDQITIFSSSFTAGNSLSVIYSQHYHDDDNDPELGTEIRWYKNEELQSDFNDLTEIDGEYIVKGDFWNVSIRVRDGFSFSDWNSSEVLIENSIPEITGLLWNPYEPTNVTDLEVLYDYYDVDNDPEVLSETIIHWYINGEEVLSNRDKSFLPYTLFQRDDIINVTVIPHDGDDNGSSYTSEIQIFNAIPTVSDYSIKNSTNIRTTDDLVASWTFNDDDNDSQNWYILYWYKFDYILFDYKLEPELTNLTSISSGNTTKRDRWRFTVQVGDERDGISIFYNASVVILNSQIRITGITINSNNSNIYANENLEVAISSFDPDGYIYNPQYKIYWYLNNAHNSSFDNQIIIPSSVIQKGQEWYCNYSIADDLGLWSEYKRSQVITIKNSKPSVFNVEFFFEHGGEVVSPIDPERNFLLEDEILTIDFSYSDLDNDQSHSMILWFLDNGTEWINIHENTNKTTLLVNKTSAGQVWRFIIQPHDGTENGSSYYSRNVTIFSRPVIINVGFDGQESKEGNYGVWVETNDLMNEINEVKFDVTIIDLNFSKSWRITSTNGTSDIFVLNELDLLSILDPGVNFHDLVGKNVSVEITIISLIEEFYSIKSRTSISFSIQDCAPPRIIRAWFDKDNPTRLTFYAEIEEYGTNISEIILYYYFIQTSYRDNTTGIGATLLQTELKTSMNYQNKSGNLYLYSAMIDFQHNQSDHEVYFRISTKDAEGNLNEFAYTNQNSTDKTIEFNPPGLPIWILYLAAVIILTILLGSFIYVRYIRKPELVGLDKDLVIEKMSQVTEAELDHAISDHTLGVVISIFDQWHGPVPLFVEPAILRDNFEKLVELSDRSFSASRFVENFDEEKPSNFEFDLAPGVSASSLTFGFSLNRPDKRGGAENINLNILVDKNYESLVAQFIDQFKDIVHEIHVLMDKKTSEKEKVTEKVIKLRKVITSIILAYESNYGSVDALDADE